MRLLDFIFSLLPRLSKDEVMEDLRITSGELTNGVMPVYEDAAKFFKSKTFNAESVNNISAVFYRHYSLSKAGRQTNFIAEIESKLKTVLDNVKFISEQNEELLERDIIKDGLSAKKATLMRSAEQLSFLTRYSIDLLNYVYIQETKETGLADEESNRMVPAMENRVVSNVANFARILSLFGDATSNLKKKLDELPDVVVNQKTYSALAAVYQEDKLDPFGFSLVQGFEGNPIYHLRLVIAEWQANRYKAYKDKKKMLELRLLNLKMLQEKEQDPKLDKEIQYLQSRIEGIEYKMTKMEDSVK